MIQPEESVGVDKSNSSVDAVGFTLIVFAALVMAFAIYGVVRVVDMPDDALNGMTRRSEVVRNIGLFLLGAIGLPLAIWRSWIAKQQVDEAIAQGSRTERQLQHAERQLQSTETTALLGVIEKAGGLLADDALSARRTAIHLLEAVIERDAGALSAAACEIVYHFVRENGKLSTSDHYFACLALLKVATRRVEGVDFLEIVPEWPAHIHLENGTLRDFVFCNQNTNFYGCVIEDSVFATGDVFLEECTVSDSLILKLRPSTRDTAFTQCDFSHSSLSDLGENCSFTDCYYYAENPPLQDVSAALASQFSVRPGRSPHFPLKEV